MEQQGTSTIGLFAESFGFGPASKAASIARGCQHEMSVRVIAYGNSIAKEFFEREGFGPVVDMDILSGVTASELACVHRSIDLAVVVVQPEWACELQGHVPVVYVDSLGFMWDSNFFGRYPKLRDVEAYVVQDFFGAAAILREQGVRNVVPTGAIVSECRIADHKTAGRGVAHLGGLMNIFSEADGISYANFALDLLEGLVEDILLSSAAIMRLNRSGFSFHSVTNAEALRTFAQSDTVITSPGLTALLELARMGAKVAPLPPQNYSQALIIAEIARALPANRLWNYLSEEYPVSRKMVESEGVSMVRSINARNANDGAFRDTYRRLLSASNESCLPKALSLGGDGVSRCIETIRNVLRYKTPECN